MPVELDELLTHRGLFGFMVVHPDAVTVTALTTGGFLVPSRILYGWARTLLCCAKMLEPLGVTSILLSVSIT